MKVRVETDIDIVRQADKVHYVFCPHCGAPIGIYNLETDQYYMCPCGSEVLVELLED